MSRGRIVAGTLLVVPALALLAVSHVWPALDTVSMSLDENATFLDGADAAVGFGNYEALTRSVFGGSLLRALLLAVVPLLLVVVAAPVLAVAAQAGGVVVRRVVRVGLALPIAAYAPVAVVVAARFEGGPGAEPPGVAGVYWWSTLGLFTALGVLAYLAVLRRPAGGRSPVPALLLVAGGAAAAVLAAALQEFTTPIVLGTRSGDAYPMTVVYRTGFEFLRAGVAAAESTVLLAVLALLGLLVTVPLLLCRARLAVLPRATTRPGRSMIGAVVAGLAGAVVLALAVVGLLPWLSNLFGAHTDPPGTPGGSGVLTWAPTLISTLVAMTVTVAAAFGIGWLRPLGEHSEWLLLPFGPFLFVGGGPLAVSRFEQVRGVDLLGSFAALITPEWVAVPALFLLTLLFRGQAAGREAAPGAAPWPALRPVLPMIGVAFLATWVVRAQDLLWPLLVTRGQDGAPGPLALVLRTAARGYGGRPGDNLPVGLALPAAAFVVLLLLTAAVQILYLDRVALKTGPGR